MPPRHYCYVHATEGGERVPIELALVPILYRAQCSTCQYRGEWRRMRSAAFIDTLNHRKEGR